MPPTQAHLADQLWISTALLVAGSDPRTMANAADLLLGQITSLVSSFSSAITPLSSSDEEEEEELDMQLRSSTISRNNNAGLIKYSTKPSSYWRQRNIVLYLG
ncbi:uncharacterized protein TrAtP1_010462 [Trichoderma atroviride]|uniref:uncharacterized protein n=1 Tax=Hypocrea atroviridis TaxID=63577 RepID=UPI00333342D3|nr:hypothetical protein TrAtP1_010462 [Trichoderma atroviride]